ncbi:MAG: M56 family metallopeptidase [Intestinimonas sp.]
MANLIAYELLPRIFNMSVTAGIVILFVLLARLLLRRAPKVFSYALWSVVLFRLLCPVSLSAGFSLLGLVDMPTRAATPHTTTVEYVPPDIVHAEDPQVQFPVEPVRTAVNEVPPQGEEQTTADPLEAPTAIATWLWLLGILAMAAYSVASYLKIRRRLVGAVPLRTISIWRTTSPPLRDGPLPPQDLSSLRTERAGAGLYHPA